VTPPQKRFLEALALGVAGILFGVFLLGAAELDAYPKPVWLIGLLLAGLVVSAALAVWRLVLFFRS